MRQTVMGVYDSYADACSAQQSLGEAGVAQADIAIYSMSADSPAEKGPRVYAPGGASAGTQTPVFDRLERLFARLFKSGEYPPEAEDYREFVRRGGTIVSADVSEMQVDLARDVMRRTGAADIEERTAAWRNGAAARDVATDTIHQGSSTAREPLAQPASLQVEQYDADVEDMSQRQSSSSALPVDEGVQRSTAFTASEPAMQQVSTRTEQTQRATSAVPDVGLARTTAGVADELKSRGARSSDYRAGVAAQEAASGTGLVGDPIMGTPPEDLPYDDDFRRDYDARYADTGASYDEYRRAYTHGTTLGQDERYGAQDWQSVEDSARADWESRYPESGWERFKAAVRHGWERVRGI